LLTRSLFTIGHSTRPLDELVEILHDYNVTILGDVRSYPGSRTNPQFNSEIMTDALPQRGIEYSWLQKLGGRRHGSGSRSKNTCWKNLSFRNYADYMETPPFQEGFAQLLELTQRGTVAIMCAETLYWKCHRSMISDFAKSRGFRVVHLLGGSLPTEHKYTECARIVNGLLTYHVSSEISAFIKQ
jgi:uncharacterized protein (DUF488 family)